MSKNSSLLAVAPAGSKCKEIPSLYVLKAVCAFCVVMIHVPFFYKDYFMPICRLAVPLFFMISGYFLSSDQGMISLGRIKKSIKKIFWINFSASFVYLIYNISLAFVLYILNGEDILWLKIFFPDYFLQKILLSNPYCGILWYLVAYMQTLLIFYVFIRCKKFSFLLHIFPFFFIGGLIIGYYNFWHPVLLGFVFRNFLTMGIPFVLLGIFIRKYLNAILQRVGAYLLFLCLFFCICAYVEYFYFLQYGCQNHGDYNLFTIILSVSVFLYFISHKNLGKDAYFEVIGKKYSLFIYLYHILFYNIIDILNYKISKFEYSWSFLIVSLFTLMSAVLFYKLKDKIIQFLKTKNPASH